MWAQTRSWRHWCRPSGPSLRCGTCGSTAGHGASPPVRSTACVTCPRSSAWRFGGARTSRLTWCRWVRTPYQAGASLAKPHDDRHTPCPAAGPVCAAAPPRRRPGVDERHGDGRGLHAPPLHPAPEVRRDLHAALRLPGLHPAPAGPGHPPRGPAGIHASAARLSRCGLCLVRWSARRSAADAGAAGPRCGLPGERRARCARRGEL